MPVHLVDHPLVHDALLVLRDKTTPSAVFRQAAARITTLLASEAMRDVPSVADTVETPIGPARGRRVAGDIVVVPVLRAGLGMLDSILSLAPQARVGHIGLQREIFRNLVIDGSYVANRGVWWQGNSLLNYNAISPAILAAWKLDPTNPNDQALLNSQIGSATAIARGFNRLPYPGFPTNQPVSQALRPFPQFTTVNAISAPLGKTWYDSFQFKATKRYSYGFDFSYAFTFQKELVSGAESDSVGPGGIGASVNDVFNRGLNKYLSGQSRPFVNVVSFSYRTPTRANVFGNKILGYVMSDWLMNGTVTYASGLPIQAPLANNALKIGRAHV